MLSNARWAVSSIAATILLRRNLAPYASKPLLPALAVEHEPFIYSGNQRTVAEEVAVAANAENTTQQHNATDGSTQVTTKEERGDVMVSHFWQRQRRTVFDTCITDADCRSYRNKAPSAVLRQQEREKIRKYKEACLEQRRDFTPSASRLMECQAERP